MPNLTDFAFYLLRPTLISSIGFVLLSYYFNGSVNGFYVIIQALLCFAGLAYYNLFVHLRFFGPFKHLPVVSLGTNDLSLINESPRGASSLEWVKQYPDADMIRAKGRLIPVILFPVSPSALRDVLTTNAYDFVKPTGLSLFLSRVIGSGLVNLEGETHKRHRRALNSSFNVKHIRALYSSMWKTTIMFLDRISQLESLEKVEISAWMSRLTFDVIGHSALSEDFGSLHEEQEHPVIEALYSVLDPAEEMVTFAGLHFLLPAWLLQRLPLSASRIHAKAAQEMDKFGKEMVTRALNRKSRGIETEHNIMSKIVDSGEFSKEELADHVKTFIAAGHETTAGSLTWALHLLTLQDGMKYQKLVRDEIRAAYPTPNSVPSYADIEALPWLNAVVEEVLRFFPLVAYAPREAVRETMIAGTRVPVGTMVFVSAWAINRNPRYWGPDAEEFKPERWIEDGRPNKHGGAPSNYCETTFLHGARACIGRDFAKAEIRTVLAALLARYEVRRLEGDDGKVTMLGTITTKPLGGLYVKLVQVPGW